MNDCPNAEIRDQLPDLLHERLDPAARAEVVMHVKGCVDCREELELLRQFHMALVQTTPRVDVSRIVAALPAPASVVRRRRTWVDWRIAAAVTVIAIGGGSAVVLSRGGRGAEIDSSRVAPALVPPPVAQTPSAKVAQTNSTESTTARQSAAATTASRPARNATTAAQGLDMTGHIGDLSNDQLQALLGDLSKMEAVPMSEPESVAVPITTRSGTADGEGVE